MLEVMVKDLETGEIQINVTAEAVIIATKTKNAGMSFVTEGGALSVAALYTSIMMKMNKVLPRFILDAAIKSAIELTNESRKEA